MPYVPIHYTAQSEALITLSFGMGHATKARKMASIAGSWLREMLCSSFAPPSLSPSPPLLSLINLVHCKRISAVLHLGYLITPQSDSARPRKMIALLFFPSSLFSF